MSITRIDNQAVKLYSPSETKFNEKTSSCDWHLPYYSIVTCDDTTEIIVDSSASSGTDISLDPDFSTLRDSTATGISADKLIDSGGDFQGTGGSAAITTQMIVRNTSTGQSANVIAIDSGTQLSLDANIFIDLFSADYIISYYELDGSVELSSKTLVKSTGGTGTVSQYPLTSGDSYVFTINLLSIASNGSNDSITVKIGSNTVAVYDASELQASTLTFYGSASSSAITIEMGSDVEASFSDFEVRELTNIEYEVVNCDSEVVVYSSVASDIVKSTESSQIKISFDWSNLMDGYDCECGCYRIDIFETGAYGSLLYSTDCFNLCDDFDCTTIKLSGTNLDNAFGIDFSGTSYTPFVRVQGQLRTPKYDEDQETEEDSNGTNKMIYFNSDKIYDLYLHHLPEHLHDFIRLLKGYDSFYINDVEYISKDAGYDPDWVIEKNKVFDLSSVTFAVKKVTELNKNRFC